MVYPSEFSPHAANFSLATSNLEAMEGSQPSSILSSSSQIANPSSKTAVKKWKTVMEKFSETTAAIMQEDPVLLDLERQKKEQDIRHAEIVFEEKREEKRRRLELEERRLKMEERQMEAQLHMQNLMQVLLSKIPSV
jgi:hypothetical protein